MLVLPFQPQEHYDRLLWTCDCNFVRGEDSFVRAQWARRPFVWNIYPQEGGAHWAKMHAFVDRYAEGLSDEAATATRELWRLWNRGETSPAVLGNAWRRFRAVRAELTAHGEIWAIRLNRLGDLATNLVRLRRRNGYNLALFFRHPVTGAGNPTDIGRTLMKTAQELRAGNVIMVGKDPLVVQRAEFNKSGRNASVMKMKLKNLLTGATSETVYRADEKFDLVVLERKEVTYSYFADPMYVFMDAEYNQYEVDKENMGDALMYLEDGMPVEVTFYEGKADLGAAALLVRARDHLYRTRGARRYLRQGAEARQARDRLRSAGAAVLRHRRQDRDRHDHRGIPPARHGLTRCPHRYRKAAGFTPCGLCFSDAAACVGDPPAARWLSGIARIGDRQRREQHQVRRLVMRSGWARRWATIAGTSVRAATGPSPGGQKYGSRDSRQAAQPWPHTKPSTKARQTGRGRGIVVRIRRAPPRTRPAVRRRGGAP